MGGSGWVGAVRALSRSLGVARICSGWIRQAIAVDRLGQVLSLDESLIGERLAFQFFSALVRLIHAAAGCQTGCIEEAFTQSLAAGLVSFAQQNPETWLWFNRLLATSVKPGARFEQVASGSSQRSFCVPKTVLVDHTVVRLKPLRHHTAVRHSVDGYFSSTKDEHVVELYEHLQGPQRAVVFVHEVTHAIHSAAPDAATAIAMDSVNQPGW